MGRICILVHSTAMWPKSHTLYMLGVMASYTWHEGQDILSLSSKLTDQAKIMRVGDLFCLWSVVRVTFSAMILLVWRQEEALVMQQELSSS